MPKSTQATGVEKLRQKVALPVVPGFVRWNHLEIFRKFQSQGHIPALLLTISVGGTQTSVVFEVPQVIPMCRKNQGPTRAWHDISTTYHPKNTNDMNR